MKTIAKKKGEYIPNSENKHLYFCLKVKKKNKFSELMRNIEISKTKSFVSIATDIWFKLAFLEISGSTLTT